MRNNSGGYTLILSAVMLSLAACAPADGPAEGSEIEMHADYPTYETREALAEAATLIVEGEVLATENTILMPRFEGDTPEENPLLGASEEEKAEAIASDNGVPATAITFRVDTVHKGDVEAGATITFIQTGGVVNGVTYRVAGLTILARHSSYLLFAKDSFDGQYAILGGSAGIYEPLGDGRFASANRAMAPAAELTRAEVEELAD